MKTQQLHQVLNAVWAVVAEANRYFAGEAPWALAKTDPRAAGHGALRHGRSASGRSPSWRSRSCRTSAASCSIFSAVPAGRARLRGARRRNALACRRTALPAPSAGVSALCRAGSQRAGVKAMLVDSHCHLDFPDFADELDAVVARARDSRHRAHGDDLDAGAGATASCLRSRSGFPTSIARSAPIRITPHEELDITAAELVARTSHPKVVAIGEAGLDYHYDNSPARRAGARLSHPHRRRARNRSAAGDPYARCRRRYGTNSRRGNGEGRLPRRAALLHRRARARDARRSRSGLSSRSPAS